jgi:alpha-tubulin suppressor-like RCC1 family protein
MSPRINRNIASPLIAATLAISGAIDTNTAIAPSNGPTPGGTSVQLDAARSYTQVAAGRYHTVAVGSDEHTYAWGDNDNGKLGNDSRDPSSVPVRVSAPAGVKFTQVTAGFHHTVAVGSDGNTYAWGRNEYGQLGNDSRDPSAVPAQFQGVSRTVPSSFK